MKSFWSSVEDLAPLTATPIGWSCEEDVLVAHLNENGLSINPLHLQIILSYAENLAPDFPWSMSRSDDGKWCFKRK